MSKQIDEKNIDKNVFILSVGFLILSATINPQDKQVNAIDKGVKRDDLSRIVSSSIFVTSFLSLFFSETAYKQSIFVTLLNVI